MNEKTTNRNLAIDVLKIFAIIMLIGCHTYNVNVPIFDVAVPLFLVIRGFNYATSMKKKNITIKSYYSKDNLSIKFKRILIPYFYFAIFEILLVLFSGNFTLTNFFRILFLGGLGMGSFYTILLIQIILVFPFIFKFIKNKKYFALICLFIIYFAFELLFNRVFDISNNIIYELWRNLIFRQIFYISCGCFIALNKNGL